MDQDYSPKPPWRTEEWVYRENIRKFEELVASVRSPETRAILTTLMAEEQRRLTSLLAP